VKIITRVSRCISEARGKVAGRTASAALVAQLAYQQSESAAN